MKDTLQGTGKQLGTLLAKSRVGGDIIIMDKIVSDFRSTEFGLKLNEIIDENIRSDLPGSCKIRSRINAITRDIFLDQIDSRIVLVDNRINLLRRLNQQFGDLILFKQ